MIFEKYLHKMSSYVRNKTNIQIPFGYNHLNLQTVKMLSIYDTVALASRQCSAIGVPPVVQAHKSFI